MFWIVVIAFWVICGVATSSIAKSKGREPEGWAVYGFLLPGIALLHAIGIAPDTQGQAVARGDKKCPDCAEFVKADARKCRFCGHEFADVTVTSVSEPPHEPAEIRVVGAELRTGHPKAEPPQQIDEGSHKVIERNTYIGISALGVLFVVYVAAPHVLPWSDAAKARRLVAARLLDPDSAEFRDVKGCMLPGRFAGEVNGKNAYGAFTGFKNFTVNIDSGEVIMEPADTDIGPYADALRIVSKSC